MTRSLRTRGGSGGRSWPAVALGFALGLLTGGPAAAWAAAPVGQTIWLRAATNAQFVCADQNAANAPLRANRAAVGAWEEFQIAEAGPGIVTIRSVGNGLYVSAYQNLVNVPLIANRAAPQGWERFRWIEVGNGQIQLQSVANGRYLSADSSLGAEVPLVANRVAASTWETFTWGPAARPTPTRTPTPTPRPTSTPTTRPSPTATPTSTAAPDFGPNVRIFDPQMPISTIQSEITSVYNAQQPNHFGSRRDALLFKPGAYNGLNIPVGFYTQVLGLGPSPDSVQITGDLRSNALLGGDNATQNFWRGAEGFSIQPSSGTIQWAVSQAVPFRRMHVRGGMRLNQNNGWSSGGWMSDVLVDGNVNSATQQQWISRNTQWGSWTGSNWNMVFVGVVGAPAGEWPSPPYTKVAQVPVVREKPFLQIDPAGHYSVRVPSLRTQSAGIGWAGGSTPGTTIPIGQFFLARPGDGAAVINAELAAGRHLIFTPGVYALNDTLRVTHPNTVVLGLGFATLRADTGLPIMTVADVDGVIVAGLFFDAGTLDSPVLLEVGPSGSSARHAANPISLHDVFFRVGGAAAGRATVNLRINAHDTLVDHTWIWRADHTFGVGWNVNPSANGLVVNGDDVTIYGLFVEHHQQYQVLWNGNGGRVYFYQSELPYDPPSQSSWTSAPGTNGWAAYKVASHVVRHEAWGLGIYSVFSNPGIFLTRAIEAPVHPDVRFHHIITVCIGGNGGISNVINSTGGATAPHVRFTPKVSEYP